MDLIQDRSALAERLAARSRPGTAGCHEWTRATTNGYGVFQVDGRLCRAHRIAYELAFGPIPDGLHIDHLCRNRRCINPQHLEAVTQAENNRRSGERRTHCPYGHLLPPHGTKRRGCKTCKKIYDHARYAARGRR